MLVNFQGYVEIAGNETRGLSHFGYAAKTSSKSRKAIHLVTQINETIFQDLLALGFQ